MQRQSKPRRAGRRAPSVQPPAMSEKAFQASVVELAARLGWRVWHDTDSRKNAPGLPDLLLVRGPRLLFVELKTARGRVRPEQRDWLAALGQTAAEVYLWRPAQWDTIVEVLR